MSLISMKSVMSLERNLGVHVSFCWSCSATESSAWIVTTSLQCLEGICICATRDGLGSVVPEVLAALKFSCLALSK